MSEKLAIELRRSSAVERAARALPAAGWKPGAAPDARHRADRISISALAYALAFPETARRLSELAAAIEAGRYSIPEAALSRHLLAEHIALSR